MITGGVHASLEAGFGSAGEEPLAGFEVGRAEGRPVHAAIAGGADLREGVKVLLEAVRVDEKSHGISDFTAQCNECAIAAEGGGLDDVPTGDDLIAPGHVAANNSLTANGDPALRCGGGLVGRSLGIVGHVRLK